MANLSTIPPDRPAQDRFEIVGRCLRDYGHVPTVAHGAGGRKLWFVRPAAGLAEYYADVIPIDLEPAMLEEFRATSRLVEQLQTIPINERLHMAVVAPRRIATDALRQEIVEQVTRWLESAPRSTGDRLEFRGGILTMLPRDKVRNHLAVVGPAFAYWIRRLGLDRALADRAAEQHAIAAESPYVLVTVAPERVGLSRRCYAELLSERPVERLLGEESDTVQQRPPLFEAHPEVSAALWIWRSSRGIWELKAIHNRRAAHPLPEGLFDPPV